MADINVDKIIHNEEIKKKWKETSLKLMKVYGYKEIMNLFFDSVSEYSDFYYSKHSFPNRIFNKKGDYKITEIADNFGLEPLGKKLRICPFHKDTNPSLSLSDEKGVFNCFGCGAKGNVITFYAMLKKVKKCSQQNKNT